MEQRRFVYILRSDADCGRHYVGLTSDVARRLYWHNNGPSGVTIHRRPWSLVVSLEFADATTAARFERYLKTGSGRAFAKRHFAATAAVSRGDLDGPRNSGLMVNAAVANSGEF